MLKVTEKTNLCQISLTGMRALVLLGLLIKAPRSLDEIRAEFIKLNIMEESHSDDILRIDLNTLRTMGCEITRSCAKTEYKYVLTSHPYTLDLDLEDIAIVRKVYKKIKDNLSIKELLEFDALLKKIASFVKNDDVKEALYGVSDFKNFDLQMIEELHEDCCQERTLKLIYRNPETKENSEKEIATERIVFQNDKIYLYGIDIEKKERVMLNIKRIKSILARTLNGGIEVKKVCVKFFVRNFGVLEIEQNETILETKDDNTLVEGVYHNEFLATQRILAFGANCVVLEPQSFKEHIIQKLKDMRNNYNG